MGHYKSNVRDLEFNLFEVLDLEKVLAGGEFGDLDAESVRQMLEEASRLAEGPLAEAFADADRNPPTFDPAAHSVSLPESFKKSFRAWQQGEWFRIGLAEDVGGVPAPSMVAWAINEFALGAQPAVFICLAGPMMANILYGIGNERQRNWASLMIERNWAATMVLTEPDAGSDVGAGRTKAIQQRDGTWHLDGVKRFITNGDTDDLFENIAHLVLARPEGAGPGTKGLSLFLVPKYLFDPETGEPGERNGVFVTNLEHKMGLKASATCELTFGSLYEGTTAIQAQDFFFRKVARDQGTALQHVVGQIQRFLVTDTARPELADARTLLATALADLQAMVTAMTAYLLDSQRDARELYRVGLESVPFLLAVGDLLIGWLLLQQAEIALAALDGDLTDRDRAFYSGKVAAARFFAKNVLPRLSAERKIIESVDLTVMDLREEAF
jgi:hypothetical protein